MKSKRKIALLTLTSSISALAVVSSVITFSNTTLLQADKTPRVLSIDHGNTLHNKKADSNKVNNFHFIVKHSITMNHY